mmetsp:Transcript_22903/g.67477  ORF Transcript_22903/g.67477 Transcript_22903/m.67477 type:complete len:504 (+) Transcript_22903:160-1671(+)
MLLLLLLSSVPPATAAPNSRGTGDGLTTAGAVRGHEVLLQRLARHLLALEAPRGSEVAQSPEREVCEADPEHGGGRHVREGKVGDGAREAVLHDDVGEGALPVVREEIRDEGAVGALPDRATDAVRRVERNERRPGAEALGGEEEDGDDLSGEDGGSEKHDRCLACPRAQGREGQGHRCRHAGYDGREDADGGGAQSLLDHDAVDVKVDETRHEAEARVDGREVEDLGVALHEHKGEEELTAGASTAATTRALVRIRRPLALVGGLGPAAARATPPIGIHLRVGHAEHGERRRRGDGGVGCEELAARRIPVCGKHGAREQLQGELEAEIEGGEHAAEEGRGSSHVDVEDARVNLRRRAKVAPLRRPEPAGSEPAEGRAAEDRGPAHGGRRKCDGEAGHVGAVEHHAPAEGGLGSETVHDSRREEERRERVTQVEHARRVAAELRAQLVGGQGEAGDDAAVVEGEAERHQDERREHGARGLGQAVALHSGHGGQGDDAAASCRA